MANKKYQNKYRIPSARAAWHDYGGGAYFVTVCTKNRAHSLGKIYTDGTRHDICTDGARHDICTDAARHVSTVDLSPVGQYLSDNLQNVSAHYPYIEIPVYVVMPNHWHAIVFVDADKTPYSRRIGSDAARDDICTDAARHDIRTDAARHVSTHTKTKQTII